VAFVTFAVVDEKVAVVGAAENLLAVVGEDESEHAEPPGVRVQRQGLVLVNIPVQTNQVDCGAPRRQQIKINTLKSLGVSIDPTAPFKM